DDAELRALRTLPELKNAREVAPRLLVVPRGTTLRALRTRPEVIDYTTPITNALEFETATRVRILQPSPRLLHRLQQIADPADEGAHHDDAKTRRTTEKKIASLKDRVAAAFSSSSVSSAPESSCPGGKSSQFELSREKAAATRSFK